MSIDNAIISLSFASIKYKLSLEGDWCKDEYGIYFYVVKQKGLKFVTDILYKEIKSRDNFM